MHARKQLQFVAEYIKIKIFIGECVFPLVLTV